jgi:hypothetical protein
MTGWVACFSGLVAVYLANSLLRFLVRTEAGKP